MSTFYKQIAKLQKDLVAPKNQYNSFGKYKYRSCEDILEGVKKYKGDLVLIINDQVEQIGDRFYVKATCTLCDGENSISSNAYARESFDKKGMDSAQITGACSSYARKYALCALLCIDDNQDPDSEIDPLAIINEYKTGINQSKTEDQLKAVFAEAWKYAGAHKASEQTKLKAAYDNKLSELGVK